MSVSDLALDPELIRRYDARFVNRHDTYCTQMADGSYRRQFRVVDQPLLAAHLAGEVTLAVYALDRLGLARWLCFDGDAPDGLEQLGEVQRALTDLGLPSLREASRRGGHLWVLCAAPQPARLLRGLGRGLVLLLQAQGRLAGPVEVYPNADGLLDAEAVGHAVRVPYGLHRLTGRTYSFLDGSGRPCHRATVPEALSWLVGQPRVSRVQLEMALIQLEEQLATLLDQVDRAQLLEPVARSADVPSPQRTLRQASARALADGADLIGWVNAYLSIPALIAETHREAQLRRAGRGWIGWCPWHDDTAPQADGRPGTPSLYVVHDRRYGWSWRCLSTHCGASTGPMHHPFDWLIWCAAGHVGQALAAARQRAQQALAAHRQGAESG